MSPPSVIDGKALLKRLTAASPSARLHALGLIDAHDLWPMLIEAASVDSRLVPVLAESAAWVEPDLGSSLLWSAIQLGDLGENSVLEDSVSGIEDETLVTFLDRYPYSSLLDQKALLLDHAIAGAGSATLRKLLADADSEDPQTAKFALRLLGMIRNPSAWNEILTLVESGRPDIAEAAQVSMAKMESTGDSLGYARNESEEDVAGFIGIASEDEPYQERKSGN